MCLCMSLSKDGRWLLVGLANGRLILYETESFQEIDSLDCLGGGKAENIVEEGRAENSKTVSYLKGAQAVHAAYHRADGVLQVSFRDGFHFDKLHLPFIVLTEGYVFKTGFVHVFQGLDNAVLGRLDHLVQHSMGASHIPTDAHFIPCSTYAEEKLLQQCYCWVSNSTKDVFLCDISNNEGT